MKSENKDRQSGLKSYRKPELRCVELVAEEVLAKGCKMSSVGQGYGNPVGCVAPNPCVNIGS